MGEGGLTKRGRDWPTALAEAAALPSWREQGPQGKPRSQHVCMFRALLAGCSAQCGQGLRLHGLTPIEGQVTQSNQAVQ